MDLKLQFNFLTEEIEKEKIITAVMMNCFFDYDVVTVDGNIYEVVQVDFLGEKNIYIKRLLIEPT